MSKDRREQMLKRLLELGEETREMAYKVRAHPTALYISTEEGDVFFKSFDELTLGRGWTKADKLTTLMELQEEGRIKAVHNGVKWHVFTQKLDREVAHLRRSP